MSTDTEYLLKSTNEDTILPKDSKSSNNDDNDDHVQIYRGRYWIIAVYSLFAMIQGGTWSIPGAIQPTLQQVYNIDGNTIQLLLNYGPIGWFVTCIPFSWLMDRQGCRLSVIISIWLIFLSQVARCFAWDTSMLSISLLHISFLLNAFAGPVAMAAVSKLSEDWFSIKERTFATSIMAEANNCAGVLIWIMVPLLVNNQDLTSVMNFNYVLVGISGVTVIMGHIYFPAHPPTPPSASALLQKHKESQFTFKEFRKSVYELSMHRSYMVINIAYACISGAANALSSLLVSILSNIGYSQTQSGWIGFASSVLGLLLGVTLSKLTDKYRNQRTVIIVLLSISSITYGIFALFASGFFSDAFLSSTAGFFLVGIFFTLCNITFDAAIPLFFELGVEVTYPIPEATVLMYMTTLMNLATSLLLAAPMDTYGVTWMPWAMAGITLFFTILIALYFGNKAPRYDYDITHKVDEENKDNILAENNIQNIEGSTSLIISSIKQIKSIQ